ncbi:class I SAM-dependent methyltransferase [Methanoregula formicica]|uniref:Methylase involved in ubiquinone/menaquinone biosynthesis n=1 Tax=Methanoregula formicica (strain DSM 22288 / NBRC 105244 / SMSP) TaxID=593750 RepID=L0HE82_METFS|nr:class I SAM-dependent methyltransferase [Methanoregula formicica]AGB01404.1 methylase involved in ubiquinone/menaquinone biosynthesis [Methanoregula formicica SMSP]
MSPGEMPRRHQHEVFSAKNAAHLDTAFRRFLYRPDRLAERYVKYGDRVLDFGCGPGFFTREFALRVGEIGQVWSADLQEEMLDILSKKLDRKELMSRVRTHRCPPDRIDLPIELHGTFDVAFAIFVLHEVPDLEQYFREIALLLKPGGTFFYTEPLYIVPGKEFAENLALLENTGFRVEDRYWYFLNRAAVLRKV